MRHITIALFIFFLSCKNINTSETETTNKTEKQNSYQSYNESESETEGISEETNNSESDNSSSRNGEEEETPNEENKYEFETHSAIVNYFNPETGFSNTYTLEVEVYNNEVTKINFPKGGWLDSDHITPEELDENGEVTIEGEDGKTYEIKIVD